MAYKFKRDEPVQDAVRRIASEELAEAVERLKAASAANAGVKTRDTAIHEARKSVKKVRGLLRLVGPSMGREFDRQNGRLRDTARLLSDLRDAGAIIGSFDALTKKYADEVSGGLPPIRNYLRKAKREHEKEVNVARVIGEASRGLRRVAGSVPEWRVREDGFEAIRRGLKTTYREGRAAMADALEDGAADDYHAWRRRVKDHWYQMRLLENLWSGEVNAREAALNELETALGEDHNLHVLAAKVKKQVPEKAEAVFVALAAREQEDLRRKAAALGPRLYDERPRDFTSRFAGLWHAWEQTGKV